MSACIQQISRPKVKEVEDRLSSYSGGGHSINGWRDSEALLISLMALGIWAGDAGIKTSVAIVATPDTIVKPSIKSVFLGVDSGSAKRPRLSRAPRDLLV